MEGEIDPKIGQCLGKLQIPKTPPVVESEFGSISVKSVGSIHKLIPSSPSEKYRCLKIETDLNLLPVSQLVKKKGDGDKIDVVGPASIITQLGKIPYSEEAGLSIGVELLDNILVLGPAIEKEAHQPRSSNDDVQADQFGYEVLIFLHEYCKYDPGAYWLHVGEDAIQLFYFPSISKNVLSSLPLSSSVYKARIDSLMAFGKLLLRVAHRLSFSTAPDDLDKCVEYLRKGFEFLNDPDHLFVRACVEEELARLILDKKNDFTEEFMIHICGAITSLGWFRKLMIIAEDDESSENSPPICSCQCVAGCCADVCDLTDSLPPTSLIDDKIWKLVFMLGEYYFGLAFRGNHQNWKIPKVPDELRRLGGELVGIFKYIENPGEMGDDDLLSAGFICLNSAKNGLGNLPKCLIQKMEKCFEKLENRYQPPKDFSEAYSICCKMGETALELAKCSQFFLMEDRSAFDADAGVLQTKLALKYFQLAEDNFTKIERQEKDNACRNEVNAKRAKTHLLMAQFIMATDAEPRKTEQSLLDAIEIYERLGDGGWKRDLSMAYMLFAEYHVHLSEMSNDKQRTKRHLVMAKNNMQKAVDHFNPETESNPYLEFLMNQSAIYLKFPHSDQNTETALECLLNARHIPKTNVTNVGLRDDFWKQLNALLLGMFKLSKDEAPASRSSSKQRKAQKLRELYTQKLRELYTMSMKAAKDFGELNSMHTIWKGASNT